jgi:lipoprotein-anchoring transpeptidase ErfK/SrfK
MQIQVQINTQTLRLLAPDGTTLLTLPVSTSKFGLGERPGSNCTPTGRFIISEKHGDHAPAGEIFVSRKSTGRIGSPEDPEDHVQTRILWLHGVDPENANTKSRYIYLHGTNQEHLLGTPASHGCVRLSNQDVIRLYDLVPAGTEVVIS